MSWAVPENEVLNFSFFSADGAELAHKALRDRERQCRHQNFWIHIKINETGNDTGGIVGVER